MELAEALAVVGLYPITAPVDIVPPSGFLWDHVSYPVRTRRFGTNYVVDCNPRAWIPGVWTAARATAIFHVDVGSGNDTTGTGIGAFIGDFSTAVKTISKAFTLGNATAGPYQVIVKAGIYNRTNGFHSIGGTVFPTQNVAVIGFGGKVVCHSADDLTYVNDGSGTNTYSTTRSSVSRGFSITDDVATVARDGSTVYDHLEYPKVADQATCQATPGSWAQVSTVLYVHRHDGAVVTNANFRATLASPVCKLDATTKNVFLKGIEFEGGVTNCLDATYAVTRNIVAEDCSFKYPATTVATGGNAVSIDNMTGIAAFVNVVAGAAPTDAFNQHQTANGPSVLLTINCKVISTGYVGNVSCNPWTFHETVIGWDINGDYRGARGGTVRNINTTIGYLVGSILQGDRGDGTTQGEIVLGDNARLFVEGATVNGVNAVSITSGAALYRKGGTYTGAQIGAGINTTYT